MSTYRILPDGTITTDDLDAALALAERMAQRNAPPRSFSVNTERGLVTTTPVRPPAAASPANVAEKVAELIIHARENPDAIAILAYLQSEEGGEITTDNLASGIGLTDPVKLSGKLAGIVKTAKRLKLDPAQVMVRSSKGYNANRVITYKAGKGLLAGPDLNPPNASPKDPPAEAKIGANLGKGKRPYTLRRGDGNGGGGETPV